MQHGKLSFVPAKVSLSTCTQHLGKGLAKSGWHSSQQGRYAHYEAERHTKKVIKRSQEIDKDFFLSVLGASATKRDAKGYLSRFVAPNKSTTNESDGVEVVTPYARGVNLGELYSSPRAIVQAPYFTQDQHDERFAKPDSKLHVAIVKLTRPQALSDDELNGIALTLGQLARLDMPSIVVLDLGDADVLGTAGYQQWREVTNTEATRLATAIRRIGKSSAQVLDQVMGCSAEDGQVRVNYEAMLSKALQNLVIPVIPPVAYDVGQHATIVSPSAVVVAIARQFAGSGGDTNQASLDVADRNEGSCKALGPQIEILLDRIIILDDVGGLPAVERRDKAHVFVNLEQEYKTIREELTEAHESSRSPPRPTDLRGTEKTTDSAILSAPAATSAFSSHLQNLEILQQTLQLLPASSSGLIIRPQDVASAALTSRKDSGVRTRQYRNPLIHNLLTDKPIVSSSLPFGRFASPMSITDKSEQTPVDSASHATFVKRGMPVRIMPDPTTNPWVPPGPEGTAFTLEDPSIDFPRLLHLIEDSFGRKLDVKHYLNRIRNRLAGVIIAGEYEGGAILTWEQPPTRDGAQRPPIPYLDKFAVLKRSQGAGGVADIVFNAMVRTSFPDGVVWRSRKNNPVNRWYFERADGTWKIPDTQWTMFWTGNELWSSSSASDNESWKRERWKDYVGVCQDIKASWADTKAPD